MKYVPPFYVITGGPGSGKTTVLAELIRRGHLCIPEDARALIQEQVASGGSALPWSDAPRFAELLMQRSLLTYHTQAATWHAQAAKSRQPPVYFDRGVGDAFTCADLIGHALSAELSMQASACRYRNPVFLAP
jgi:predicted ATPase